MAIQLVGSDASTLLGVDSATQAAKVLMVTPATTRVRINSAATNNAQIHKIGPGNIYSILLTNTSASLVYFKVYDKASAPTVGTDTPILSFGVPANDSRQCTIKIPFTLGFATAIVTGGADSDNTAVTLGQLKAIVEYDT